MSSVGKASVRDVAREAGVSIGSVSRVLNDGPHVSAALRARVMAAVQRMGYEANVHARGLRLGSSRIIGCVVPEIRNPIYGKIIESVEAAVTRRHHVLLLGNSHGDSAREAQLLRFLQAHGVDGLVITPSVEREGFINGPLGQCRMPMVVVDRDIQGSRDCVMLDQRGGVHSATEHLLNLGHRRIALFTGGHGFWSGRERRTGYEAALKKAGLMPAEALIRQVHSWAYSAASACADMRELLALPADHRPSAVIAPSTHIMVGILRALREENRSIPRDFSVIAIGPSDAIEFATPPLTIVRWNAEEHATLAVELLFARLALPDGPMQRRVVPTELVLGQSCAPLR